MVVVGLGSGLHLQFMTNDIVCCFDIENSATFQYSSLAIYCLELYEAYKETVACVISLIFIGAYVAVCCGDAER